MMAPEVELPPVGYDVAECERIAGAAHKTLYRKIKEGKLLAFVGDDNKLKVSREELYRYLSTLEK